MLPTAAGTQSSAPCVQIQLCPSAPISGVVILVFGQRGGSTARVAAAQGHDHARQVRQGEGVGEGASGCIPLQRTAVGRGRCTRQVVREVSYYLLPPLPPVRSALQDACYAFNLLLLCAPASQPIPTHPTPALVRVCGHIRWCVLLSTCAAVAAAAARLAALPTLLVWLNTLDVRSGVPPFHGLLLRLRTSPVARLGNLVCHGLCQLNSAAVNNKMWTSVDECHAVARPPRLPVPGGAVRCGQLPHDAHRAGSPRVMRTRRAVLAGMAAEVYAFSFTSFRL